MKKFILTFFSCFTVIFGAMYLVVNATVFNSNQVGTSPANGYYLQTNGATSTWVTNPSQWTPTSTGIFYNGGNVGVGTASPSTKLEVSGGSIKTGLSLMDTNGQHYGIGIQNITTANNARLDLPTTGATISRNVGDANVALIVNQINASSTGDILDIKSGGAIKAAFLQNGNIGFGTSTPSTLFQVYGTSTFMTGNVGIGTTTPSVALQLAASAQAPFQIIGSGAAGVEGMSIFNNGTSGHQFQLLGTNTSASTTLFGNAGGFAVYDATAGITRLAVTSGGNVGIATTTPPDIFDVANASGSINFAVSSSSNSTFSLDVIGNNLDALTVNATSGQISLNTTSTFAGTTQINSNNLIDASGNKYATSTGIASYNVTAGTYLGVTTTTTSAALTVSSTLATSSWKFTISAATTTASTTNYIEWQADQQVKITNLLCKDTVGTTTLNIFIPTTYTTTTVSSTIASSFACGTASNSSSTNLTFAIGTPIIVMVSSTAGTPVSTPVQITYTKL